MVGDVPPSPRFRSQGFSPSQRFASRLEVTGLFHPAAVRATSFRAFPSQGSRAPLEAASSPAVLHRGPGRDSQRLVARGFPDSHAHAQSPGSPTNYGLPFRALRRPRFPFTLGAEHRGRPLTQLRPPRSLLPPGSPFTTTRVAPRARPLLSWRSALLELPPPEPRRLCPLEPHDPSAFPPPKGRVRGLQGPTRCRSLVPTPGARWGLATQNAAPTPSVVSSPVWTGPRRLSTTRLLSWPSIYGVNRTPWPSELPSIQGVDDLERSPSLPGFLASSSTSQLRDPA